MPGLVVFLFLVEITLCDVLLGVFNLVLRSDVTLAQVDLSVFLVDLLLLFLHVFHVLVPQLVVKHFIHVVQLVLFILLIVVVIFFLFFVNLTIEVVLHAELIVIFTMADLILVLFLLLLLV